LAVSLINGTKLPIEGVYLETLCIQDATGAERSVLAIFRGIDLYGFDMVLGMPWICCARPVFYLNNISWT
jgi:hypothetical protein